MVRVPRRPKTLQIVCFNGSYLDALDCNLLTGLQRRDGSTDILPAVLRSDYGCLACANRGDCFRKAMIIVRMSHKYQSRLLRNIRNFLYEFLGSVVVDINDLSTSPNLKACMAQPSYSNGHCHRWTVRMASSI